MRPSFALERKLAGRVCGIDEAGRGPLAGPVVAAAVIMDPERRPRGINDSKQLEPEQRERLYGRIMAVARVGVGEASVEEIDRYNILAATMLAMHRAIQRLPDAPDHALIDGNYARGFTCPVTTVIGGDARSVSIAAASIVAKVTRDRFMTAAAAAHPGYGWETNKGYATPEHCAALERLGPTPLHRRSFAPVRAQLPSDDELQIDLLTALAPAPLTV